VCLRERWRERKEKKKSRFPRPDRSSPVGREENSHGRNPPGRSDDDATLLGCTGFIVNGIPMSLSTFFGLRSYRPRNARVSSTVFLSPSLPPRNDCRGAPNAATGFLTSRVITAGLLRDGSCSLGPPFPVHSVPHHRCASGSWFLGHDRLARFGYRSRLANQKIRGENGWIRTARITADAPIGFPASPGTARGLPPRRRGSPPSISLLRMFPPGSPTRRLPERPRSDGATKG